MLQRIISVYQRLFRIARQPASPRRRVTFEVRPLEERATPAVGFMVSPIESFLPAPMVELGMARAPIEDQPDKMIIRIDFISGSEAPRPEANNEWEDWLASMNAPVDPLVNPCREEPESPTATAFVDPEDLPVTEEDLLALRAERAERLEMQAA